MARARRTAPAPATVRPTSLHLPLRPTVDYVAGFQDLARLGLLMDRSGPNVALLLRKATLELCVGGYEAACHAASQALLREPTEAEAHWLHALAQIGLCLVDLSLLTEGPGNAAPHAMLPPTARLELACASLQACAKSSHGADQDAVSLLAYLEAVLASRPSRSLMRELLRCLA